MRIDYGEYFNDRMYIEVNKTDLRLYEINIEILTDKIKVLYKWDYTFTNDGNICEIQNQIERAILNYFRR